MEEIKEILKKALVTMIDVTASSSSEWGSDEGNSYSHWNDDLKDRFRRECFDKWREAFKSDSNS